MNKFICLILVLVCCYSCDSENANDCFQKSGTIITQEIELPTFSKIRVNRDISLVIKEGSLQQVKLETGENLWNDVEFTVTNDQLTVTNHNTCNFVRDYNITKVYVTLPNLKELISSTQYQITSDGMLNFDFLKITSEDYIDKSVLALGEVNLGINAQKVEILGNNRTSFTLHGNVDKLHVNFADGNGFFNGRELQSNKVQVYHRGTNTITVNPIQELSAELRSTGNVIALQEPPVVHIEELYTGRVIFE